jgi:hypothetical protein
MEDHDFRVIEARASLAKARKREPGELGLDELREEITRFRKYVRWLIDLADDAADTEYDEEVSQVMIYGGIYIAPADTFKLCDGCMQVLALIWAASEQENACPASTPADSAALA